MGEKTKKKKKKKKKKRRLWYMHRTSVPIWNTVEEIEKLEYVTEMQQCLRNIRLVDFVPILIPIFSPGISNVKKFLWQEAVMLGFSQP